MKRLRKLNLLKYQMTKVDIKLKFGTVSDSKGAKISLYFV